jgi:SAM-dependent methyltransferase
VKPSDIRGSYDNVAEKYARHLHDELAHKPFDREILERFAREVGGHGPVLDVGCGPGHVGAYLHARGVDVRGLDLSLGMIRTARGLHPDIEFAQGDMTSIGVPEQTLAGVVAFYAIVHLSLSQLPAVFREFRRVLRRGGWLLAAYHAGSEVLHRDELWEQLVNLDFFLLEPDRVTECLREDGFEIVEAQVRDPYPDVEYPSRRAYVLARVR